MTNNHAFLLGFLAGAIVATIAALRGMHAAFRKHTARNPQ